MKRVFNGLIFLVLVGAVLFVAVKAKLIPNPLDRGGRPAGLPTPGAPTRDELRVAVAERPERALITSLERLMKVQNQKFALVDYHPDTVWLELANGEIDLVIAPVGEAVKAQGPFKAGRFLFFTGRSVGLDKLLSSSPAEKVQKVGTVSEAATDFLALRMLPESQIVPSGNPEELEAWLEGGAVEAALLNTSRNTPALFEKYEVLSTTTEADPMPTVAVLSKPFAENAGDQAFEARKRVLLAALGTWSELVGYLDSQPDFLRATLQKDAAESGVDVDKLLADYEFLPPGAGRVALMNFQQSDGLRETLNLLVLSGTENLTAPDWSEVVALPSVLSPAFQDMGAPETAVLQPPSDPITASPTPPATSPTPGETPEPGDTATPVAVGAAALDPTYTYPGARVPAEWPEPLLQYNSGQAKRFPPALSRKQVALAADNYLYLHDWQTDLVKVPLASAPTSPPLSDGRLFFYSLDNKIVAVNAAGKQVWEHTVKGTPLAAATVARERLFYAVDEGDRARTICLDPVDGERLWEAVSDTPPASGPVLGGDPALVVVPDRKGYLRAYDFESGAVRWESSLENPVYIPLAAGHGKVAAVEPNGKVTVFSLENGERQWGTNLATSLIAPPTITSAGLLVPSKDTYLYYLNNGNGNIVWKASLAQIMSEPAVVTAETVLQATEGGEVHTIQLTDGKVLSKVKLSEGWVSRPVFADDKWAVMDAGGRCSVYE